MPIYAYKCGACGYAQDVLQKISAAPLTVCPSCGASAFVKQVTAAGFQLKGSGWYVTDFRGGGDGAHSGVGKPAEAGSGATGSGAGDAAKPAAPAQAGGAAAASASAPPAANSASAASGSAASGSAASGSAASGSATSGSAASSSATSSSTGSATTPST